MQARVSLGEPGGRQAADQTFPLVRFDTGPVCYTEALIAGRYLLTGCSAMGRPMSRQQVWQRHQPPASVKPWPWREAWQGAFRLQVDGQALDAGWEWAGADEAAGPQPDTLHHTVRLRSTLKPLEVAVHTLLDGTPFLTRWLEVTSIGQSPSLIAEAATWNGQVWRAGQSRKAPLRTDPAFRLGRFHGHLWDREGMFGWQPLGTGWLVFDSAAGKSGWNSPYFILQNLTTGENLIGQLAWSGNWAIHVLQDRPAPAGPVSGTNQPTEVYVRAELAGAPPLGVLAPGECIALPAFHFGFMFGGLDDCVQALHAHQRRSVTPIQPGQPHHPVEYNTSGYSENAQLSEADLLRQVDVAAEVGCELFVVDAGWFGDSAGPYFTQLGDWQENPKLAGRLRTAFDRARALGLKAGLWVEIEGVVPDSKAGQAHPEWLLTRRGVPMHQLDLARPEVQAHIYETLVGLIDRYALDYLRLDYNAAPGEGGERRHAGGILENTLWRYYLALYQMIDRLRERYPNLLLENCASGGGRMDLGMMSCLHWTQASDLWEPQAALKIVNGLTLALPPEQVMSLLGAISFEGVADLDFMLRIGLFGHLCLSGIFPSQDEIHAPSLARWQHAVQLYKEFVRPMLGECRLYHHSPVLSLAAADEWCVLEMVSANRARAMLGAWRFPGAMQDQRLVRLRGLYPGWRYRLTADNTGLTREASGASLMDRGVSVRAGAAGQSELLLLEAVDAPHRKE